MTDGGKLILDRPTATYLPDIEDVPTRRWVNVEAEQEELLWRGFSKRQKSIICQLARSTMNSIPINHFKICAEALCDYVYVPDETGKCPRCGSDGIWLANTPIMKGEAVSLGVDDASI